MENPSLNNHQDYYFNWNCKALISMSNYINPLYLLNAALLDNDKIKINKIKTLLKEKQYNYEIINIGDRIKNKRSLRIVYLISSTSFCQGAKIIFEQSNLLSYLGHDVLIFSHNIKPDWIDCKSKFFLVHPSNNLSHVIPSADIVIAGDWNLTLEAIKVDCPIKYHFDNIDYTILEPEKTDLKTAITVAYTLPLRIVTFSDIMSRNIKNLYGRKSILLPISNNIDKFEKSLKASVLQTYQAVGL